MFWGWYTIILYGPLCLVMDWPSDCKKRPLQRALQSARLHVHPQRWISFWHTHTSRGGFPSDIHTPPEVDFLLTYTHPQRWISFWHTHTSRGGFPSDIHTPPEVDFLLTYTPPDVDFLLTYTPPEVDFLLTYTPPEMEFFLTHAPKVHVHPGCLSCYYMPCIYDTVLAPLLHLLLFFLTYVCLV